MVFSNTIFIVWLFVLVDLIAVPLATGQLRRKDWHRITNNLGMMIVSVAALAIVIQTPLFAWSRENLWTRPLWMQGLIFVALDLLFLDFCNYGFHWLSHHVPFLWRLHAVHHLDREVDFSTALRTHWLAKILGNAYIGAIVLFSGVSLSTFAAVKVVSLAFSLYTHQSKIRMPLWFEETFGKVFVTPCFHSVHHTPSLPFTNTNYGFIFTIWDKLFRTSLIRKPRAPVRFGLDHHADPNFFTLLIAPLSPTFLSKPEQVKLNRKGPRLMSVDDAALGKIR